MIRSRAPVRVSLAGGGTDIPPYCTERGGAVVCCTIGHYAYANLELYPRSEIRLASLENDLEVVLNELSQVRYDGRCDLAKAALKVLNIEGQGLSLGTFCEVQPGSGLGSSSATAVAILGALNEGFELGLGRQEIAEIACRVERIELVMAGGYQDQYASAFGGWNLIEFKKSGIEVHQLRLAREVALELEGSLMLMNTGIVRFSPSIQEDLIREMKDRGTTYDALDRLKELAYRMKKVLEDGNLSEFGSLLDEGWKLKRTLSRGISSSEIDRAYQMAIKAGARGGKLLGAGGGGHLLLYCPPEERPRVLRELQSLNLRPVAFGFDESGIQTWRA